MTESDRLRIVRRFDVPPRKVFDAFTEPDAMRVWWTPDTSFDLDLRVGGRWRITRPDGDETLVMEGAYLEVDPPTRLRFTIAMPQFSGTADEISLTVEPDGVGCVVTFEQTGDGIADELRALPTGATSASEAGWQQGFDLMEGAWRARPQR
ncbi:MAG: SRPBCC domain-containing protein [Trueperaceae bacterium]|nr:MAG: SRPBCC domain-containing protein [Trueperaceae bacterium]